MSVNARVRAAGSLAMLALVLLPVGGGQAGMLETVRGGTTPVAAPAAADEGIQILGDHMEYQWDRKIMLARGNVLVQYKDVEIHADRVYYYPERQEVEVRGNVTFRRADAYWEGDRARYNLATGKLHTGKMRMVVEPFHVRSRTSRRAEGNTFALRDVTLSTCELPDGELHWHIRAREALVTPGKRIEARGVSFHLGRTPLLYVPYWVRNAGDGTGFNVVPGYSSRMGAFLLNSYTYRLTPELKGITRIDYRTRRGVAYGQDFRWKQRPSKRWAGKSLVYYADDMNPNEEDEDPELEMVDETRYRIAARHTQHFDDRTYMLGSFDYQSDPDVREDFFANEYKRSYHPENFASLTHRGSRYTANLLYRRRMNDFYSMVDRVPEASLEFPRQQVGGSRLYYEGETSAVWLRRLWEEAETNETDFVCFRFDSAHMLYVPTRWFGFLTVIPRGGYRATYYSKRITTYYSTVVATNEFGQVTTNALDPMQVEIPGETRSLGEYGVETSLKAFKVWDTGPGSALDGLRHVAQPYANYTHVGEPSVARRNIYQFDGVDALEARSDIRFGMRNKLQTRRAGRIHDLLDIDVFTRYTLDPDEDDRELDDISVDGEIECRQGVRIDFDLAYDTYELRLNEFNAELDIRRSKDWTFSTELRIRDTESTQSKLITVGIGHRFNESRISEWHAGAELRYEFEDARLEEHAYSLQRRMDCMVARLGVSHLPGYEAGDGRWLEDEYKGWLEIWLTAFPKMTVAVGR